jgi:hypothetical protein
MIAYINGLPRDAAEKAAVLLKQEIPLLRQLPTQIADIHAAELYPNGRNITQIVEFDDEWDYWYKVCELKAAELGRIATGTTASTALNARIRVQKMCFKPEDGVEMLYFTRLPDERLWNSMIVDLYTYFTGADYSAADESFTATRARNSASFVNDISFRRWTVTEGTRIETFMQMLVRRERMEAFKEHWKYHFREGQWLTTSKGYQLRVWSAREENLRQDMRSVKQRIYTEASIRISNVADDVTVEDVEGCLRHMGWPLREGMMADFLTGRNAVGTRTLILKMAPALLPEEATIQLLLDEFGNRRWNGNGRKMWVTASPTEDYELHQHNARQEDGNPLLSKGEVISWLKDTAVYSIRTARSAPRNIKSYAKAVRQDKRTSGATTQQQHPAVHEQASSIRQNEEMVIRLKTIANNIRVELQSISSSLSAQINAVRTAAEETDQKLSNEFTEIYNRFKTLDVKEERRSTELEFLQRKTGAIHRSLDALMSNFTTGQDPGGGGQGETEMEQEQEDTSRDTYRNPSYSTMEEDVGVDEKHGPMPGQSDTTAAPKLPTKNKDRPGSARNQEPKSKRGTRTHTNHDRNESA